MEAVIEFLKQLTPRGVKLSVKAGQLNCFVEKGTLATDISEGLARYETEIVAIFDSWRDAAMASIGDASHAGDGQPHGDVELPAAEVFADVPRLAPGSFDGEIVIEDLPQELSRRLLEFSRAHSLPPSVMFLSVFQLLLHRYTNEDDIVIGMPVMGCFPRGSVAHAGAFVNQVPIRTNCDERERLSDFMRRVQRIVVAALQQSSDAFPVMLDRLHLKDTSEKPLFQGTYAYRNDAQPIGFTTAAQQRRPSANHGLGIAQDGDFALGLAVLEHEAGLSLHVKYNPALYTQDTATRFSGHYRALLKEISEKPDLPLHEYPILTKDERHRIVVDFNATQADYPKDQCIHELFNAQVPQHSDSIAIVCGDERLTYQQLYARSRDLALYLQSEGVKPDSLVGLCMDRSLDMLVGMLGILQAGGAYVPLDPNYPDERLAYMLEDSQAAIVLTQDTLWVKLSGLVRPGTQVFALDRQAAEIGERVAELKADRVPLREDVGPHHLAYVVYTSGSTGKPKGVAIEHHSPATLVYWARGVFSREELAGVLASTSICFDLSVYEIFVTLASGGTIILVPNALELVHLASPESVTLINTVPSAMEELLRMDAIPDSVLTINSGGEALSARLADKIYDSCGVKKVYDLYGPSEDTVYSMCVLREKDGPQTIGQPIANTQIYILDSHQHVQPIGVPGELHLAGDGLARGYLNRPELTQKKFVANPFAPGTRMYKTGDRARWLEDGNVEYLGRLDTQVKIRGFRIEIGEIEMRLSEHAGIQDCAVVVQGEEASKQLIAFYRATDTIADRVVHLPYEELRAHLLRTLPEYMAPAAFVSLAAIPLTPNGKVDRTTLSRTHVTIESAQEYLAPRNETERQLVEICAEVLNLAPEKIGVNDDFFELGGQSLLATQVISRIRSRLNSELSLKALFERPSVAQLAELIGEATKSDIPPIERIDRAQFERVPLSFAQEGLWFINQLDTANVAYNVPVAVTISGKLDVSQLEEAFKLIIARHENLRTVFPSREGQPWQQILDRLDFNLERINLSDCESKEARDRKAKEICQADGAAPFDLARGPLFRGKVITLAEDEHILMLVMHHIISDGWSLGVLTRELGLIMEALRQGRHPELAPLPIQYVDYSVWQRKWLEEGGVLKRQLAYWQEKLAGVPESLDLITDYPRPSAQSFARATHAFALDAQLTGQLRSLAQQSGGTLYMILLAAFKVLLYRYTGQNDLCVGSPIANRQYGETEGVIGMFVNTLALRSRVEGEETFSALLSQIRETCFEAYENQDAPFEKVVDLLCPQRNLNISPLFQMMFVLQNADMGALDARFPRYPLESGISTFDLTAEFTETPEGLAGALEYVTALHKPAMVERMARHFTALCRAIVSTPSARICDLDYLGEAEKHQLLIDFNETSASYPQDKCIHELFVEQVALHPDRTAVVFGERALSYRELHDQSRDLALYLQSLGVKPDSVVGLCVERSLEMMVGLLGILQAGGAYMPLDPEYPDERLAYMLRDSGAAIVLTQGKLEDQLAAVLGTDTRLVAVDRQWPEIAERVGALKANRVQLQEEVKPHHLAYVIYTSGSTGMPKGVLVEHQAVNRLVLNTNYIDILESDAFLQLSSLSFDAATFEIWGPLLNGARLVVAPHGQNAIAEIEQLITTYSISVLWLTSGLFQLIARERVEALSGVRVLITGGDVVPVDCVRLFLDRCRSSILINAYGPTETTTFASCYVVPKGFNAITSLPIGRPIANAQIYILDAYGNPQPVGIPGELHISGDGLARGYQNRPDLTQERFVANPFILGTRMYRSGDLARWLEDGNLEFLGRRDTQVKIRGYRIEIGEIEAELNRHPEIGDSVVVAQGDEGDKRLVAFYRAKRTDAEELVTLPSQDLRTHLRRTLPAYMAPAAFVSLAAIPLNANGKVDRLALSRMHVTIESAQEYLAPRNETERRLVEICAEVLNLAPEKIGVNDDFFELGGQSLLATQVISRIRSGLNIDVPLKALFERPSVAQLAELIGEATKSDIALIERIDRAQFEQLPLSFAQERLWFINQLDPDSVAYNVPVAVTISGELDVSQLDEAFKLIIARHENLRTVFPSREGQPWQRILDRLDFHLERVDLSDSKSKEARDRKAKEICQADGAAPFDLARGPLFRGKVITLAEDEHILMLVMHHIISDGWSLGVLTRELGLIMEALRQGRHPELAPLPIQYVDYSVWQRKWLEEGGVLKRQLAYWQEKLAGVPESLDLITDYPRPSAQSFARATHAFALDAQLTGQLRSLAQQSGGTLYMILLAAFKVLLYRYTGQNDLCVGSPIANRQYGETEGVIGMFVNTLALRSRVEGEETFSALLSQIRETCFEAYENQDAPFEKVVDLLRPQRNLDISPLFQVMFVLQNADMGTLDSRFPPYPLESGISTFDLTAEFTETREGLAGALEYVTALYKSESVERMATHFTALCRAIASTPSARICDLDYLGEAEKHQLLIDFNETSASDPQDKCIHQLFSEQVLLHPDRTAVVFGDEQLTYRQLDERSQMVALFLQSEGVQPDGLVAVCMERSLDMMVCLLGILQAGGAYVPLEPDYPEERLAYMLRDSGAAIVLTQEAFEDRLTALAGADTRLVVVDRQWPEIEERVGALKANGVQLQEEVEPHHLAYVIYTSGSTGKPKGVMVEHANVVRLFSATDEWFQFGEDDVWTLFHSYAFDFSVWEIWGALLYGGRLVVVPRDIARSPREFYELLCRCRVTVLNQTPSAFRQLISAQTECSESHQLRYVIFGGEALEVPTLKPWYEQNSQQLTQLINMYGITETTVHVTYRPLESSDTERRGASPIGRRIPDLRTYILDPQGRPVPIGVPGELYVSGAGVARGYLNRPELTAERFMRDPFAAEPGTRRYKTGDLGRWLADGTMEFLGRNDDQVKIRGFRIELGEIEARLRECVGIREAVVVAREDGAGEKRLIAYYTCGQEGDGGEESGGARQLRAQLLGRLPEHMVPAAYVRMEKLPLTANGKLDRKALPLPDVEAYANRGYETPQGKIETTLAEIWAEVLKLERVGRHDSFFELGGHSLLATQLISKIRSRLEVDVPLKALFERTSVAQFAELIARAEESDVPRIQPVERARFERLPLSFAQERLWFFDQLEPGSAGYNVPMAFTIRGELEIDQLDQAFNRIIARHENLRTLFPSQDGQAQQLIQDSLNFKVERVDLSHYDSREVREEKADEVCRNEAATPFDLARGPLIRGKVIKLAEHEHLLMLNLHHIVSDGWSIGILIKELGLIMDALREGRHAELTPLPIQYVDYSVWQRQWLEEGGRLKQQLAYWQQKLAGVPESLDLPADYPRPNVQSFAGATHAFTMDAQLTARLKSLAERKGGTLFMSLLAAFKVLLYRYSGQSDLCVGSAIANRQYGETEDLIGMFVNTLPLRSQVEGEDTFSALLSQVKATCLEAYEHQDTPFEKVVDMLRPQRNLAISPIFQVMLILQNADMGTLDRRFAHHPLDTGLCKFDLTAEFIESPEGLAGTIEYSTALYKPQTIARMAEHFVALCQAIAVAPTARIRDLDYLGEVERRRLLVDFNATQADYPKDKCIHELFNAQVLSNPGKTAVVYGEQTLSYQELYDRSCDLALYLQSLGVKPDSLVGLCVERSLEMMVGIMGTEQAGGAYLPADPSYPDDRLAYMLQDSRAEVVLTQEKFKARVGSLLEQDATVIALDQQWPEIQKCADALKARGIELRRDVTPRDVSYLIYTSGSTGKPKGVLVEHQALVNRIHWMQKRYPLDQTDVVLQKTPYSFDVSVWEFFWPMMTGATVVFAAPEGHKDVRYLETLIDTAKVTTLHYVPSMLHVFLDMATVGCNTVRRIFCSGEALDRGSADRYKNNFPHAELHNLYGPTEAAIDVTAYDCAQSTYPFVPIGAPIDNTQIYILDPHNHPQPIGVPGELHIAGDGLARGYLNRPELTQEKFVANPFLPGARMYKTGDLARWLDDGNIQYLGRIDSQVKIRGLRIELGEIEAALNQHPQIRESAVIAQGEGSDKQLIAFYRAADTTADHVVHLPYEELRAHLLTTLPEYMAPAAFVTLAAIPLNSSGKVDRRALSRMDVRPVSGQEYVAPRNEVERKLVEIWAHVLGREAETLGVNDNFFEQGGHSLLAVRLIERMRQQGLRGTLQALFAAPTVAKLAVAVDYDRASDVAAETAPDLDREATLDPTIVLRTLGTPGEVKNAFLTGSTGFLGAFLLSELLVGGRARIYCLVRAAGAEAGHRKIEEHMRSFGLWNPALSDRIVAVPGDLASPLLGLTQKTFDELAGIVDVIYHSGANVNFYYPYSVLKAANVLGTEELLRMASVGRSKSFHFVSTLGVVLAERRDASRSVIREKDPLPGAHHLLDGYAQSKWVAEKLVEIAASRGIPVVTYRPGTIVGHSRTGTTNLQDFAPSLIRGCMQMGYVPAIKVSEELHMMPVDHVSRSIVAISKRPELFGRSFNLTNSHGTTVREMFECLLEFDPTLQRVSYEKWRSTAAGDPGNALMRYIGSFPEQIPDAEEHSLRPQFDSEETLKIMEAAGIERSRMTQQALHPYFSYIAECTTRETLRRSVS